jgi:hypothetical protein
MLEAVLYHVTSDSCVKEFLCRHCDKPISMLTRLAGEKEFCCKEHRQIYLSEHSQAALARLIQAEEQDDRRRNRSGSKGPMRERLIPLPEPVAEPEDTPPPMAAVIMLAVGGAKSVGEAKAPGQPRWRPILIRPAAACMEEGLDLVGPGEFLYRDPAIAAAEFPWGAERNRIRAVTFPRIAPRMRYLEDCLRRTERLGFSPP